MRGLFAFQLYTFIVVEVDVLFDHTLSLLEAHAGIVPQSLFLELGKETLGGGIVPAIAFAGH
jgi:hypothetical protein